MQDPNLYDAMHGVITTPKVKKAVQKSYEKNRFEEALDEMIRSQVDEQMKNEDPHAKYLDSPELRRAHLEQQARESLDLGDFGHYMQTAAGIFNTEAKRYIGEKESRNLAHELEEMYRRLDALDVDSLDDKSLKTALIMPDSIKSSILKIAIAKFDEGLFPESLAVFAFLTSVEPDDPDYWYRFGLVAQECGKFELAIRSFDAVSKLAPDFLGSQIFASQCHFYLGKLDDAKAGLTKIKVGLEKNQAREKWINCVNDLENLLALGNSK